MKRLFERPLCLRVIISGVIISLSHYRLVFEMLSNSHQVDKLGFYFEEMQALLREVVLLMHIVKSDGFVKVSL